MLCGCGGGCRRADLATRVTVAVAWPFFCTPSRRVRVSRSAASSSRQRRHLSEVSRLNKVVFAPHMAATPFRRGFGTAASPAASPLPQYSEDSPLPFYASSAYTDGVGVFCTGPNQFEVIVRIRGQLARVPGFSSIATATEAFRRMQNGMSRSPVADAPELSRAPKPAPEPVPELQPAHVPAPEPACAHGAPPVKHYKGVYPQAKGTFTAAFRHNGKLKGLGSFPTPALAASAYDDAVRSIGGKTVNTPRCPGEIQAVPMHRKNAAAPKPAPAGAVPDAQANKRKRGRPRKVIREDGAAVPASPAAAAAAVAATPSQLAAAAAQFRGVTAISGGSGFFAWLSFCNADGSLIRKMLGAFGTAEEAAVAVDVAARRHSQLEQLNFPTTEELARMDRQTRSTHHQAGRYIERKMPDVADESEDEDVDPAPRGMPRRRMQSPTQARRNANAPDALAQAVSSPPEEPEAPPPPPPQPPPVTPDPLALLAPEAPATEASPPPQYQPNDDVVAFLCSISPPLRCLAAAVSAAPGSGVSMRQLHQLALLRNSALLAAYFDNVAASLNINGTGDRLDLMAALDRLGP